MPCPPEALMTITIDPGTGPITLIAGPTRTAQQICGPVDEQSLEDQLQVQMIMPLRAVTATPVSRGNISGTFRFAGTWLDNTEDLAREWAWTWPYLCPRTGTLYITGASRRVIGANAVIKSMPTRAIGCSGFVKYEIVCGAVTAGANP